VVYRWVAASAIVHDVQRVAIVGPVGSGKSTLARELAAITGLAVLHLDDLYWRDGPVPSESEWAAKHAALIATDRWIVDGDYRATAPSRFARADMVVWLDPGPWRCSARILRRHFSGYPAPLRDCLRWTWRYPRHGRRETTALLSATRSDVAIHHLRHRSDVALFLERIRRA
jgi:adenylate kinase family enzyme